MSRFGRWFGLRLGRAPEALPYDEMGTGVLGPAKPVTYLSEAPKIVPGPMIHVSQARESRPRLDRTYRTILPYRQIVLELYAWCFWARRNRSWSGTLTQPGPAYVAFDPLKPADKILDRELLPHVIEATKAIFDLDRDFMATDPREYVDEDGATWRRIT